MRFNNSLSHLECTFIQSSTLTSAYKAQFEYTRTDVPPRLCRSEHSSDVVVKFHTLQLLPTFFSYSGQEMTLIFNLLMYMADIFTAFLKKKTSLTCQILP